MLATSSTTCIPGKKNSHAASLRGPSSFLLLLGPAHTVSEHPSVGLPSWGILLPCAHLDHSFCKILWVHLGSSKLVSAYYYYLSHTSSVVLPLAGLGYPVGSGLLVVANPFAGLAIGRYFEGDPAVLEGFGTVVGLAAAATVEGSVEAAIAVVASVPGLVVVASSVVASFAVASSASVGSVVVAATVVPLLVGLPVVAPELANFAAAARPGNLNFHPDNSDFHPSLS